MRRVLTLSTPTGSTHTRNPISGHCSAGCIPVRCAAYFVFAAVGLRAGQSKITPLCMQRCGPQLLPPIALSAAQLSSPRQPPHPPSPHPRPGPRLPTPSRREGRRHDGGSELDHDVLVCAERREHDVDELRGGEAMMMMMGAGRGGARGEPGRAHARRGQPVGEGVGLGVGVGAGAGGGRE